MTTGGYGGGYDAKRPGPGSCNARPGRCHGWLPEPDDVGPSGLQRPEGDGELADGRVADVLALVVGFSVKFSVLRLAPQTS